MEEFSVGTCMFLSISTLNIRNIYCSICNHAQIYHTCIDFLFVVSHFVPFFFFSFNLSTMLSQSYTSAS